jgi:subtilisin-like proprotein convertase family protein
MTLKSLLTWAAIQSVAGSAALFAQVTLTTSYNSGFQGGGLIPDDSLTGWSNSQSVSISGNGPITDIKVSLNISGGANSDLYGYLSGPNGGFSILLNQVGKTTGNSIGYLNTGFNVTFDGSAANDIHIYQTVSYSLNGSGQLTGTWQPDGRPLDTAHPENIQNTTMRSDLLNSFENKNPNGQWTLFLADLSSGERSTVVSWGMQITAVPEPGESAVMAALVLAAFAIAKRTRNRFHRM